MNTISIQQQLIATSVSSRYWDEDDIIMITGDSVVAGAANYGKQFCLAKPAVNNVHITFTAAQA